MSDTEYQGVPEEAAATEFEVRPRLDGEQLRAIVEALIFASPEPLTPKLLFKLLADEPREDVSAAVEAVRQDYANRAGLHVVEVAGGYQITTRPELHEWVRRLFHERSTQKLSVAALETLSVVAYKQPITRAEIEELRGVDVSGVVNTLTERGLIKIVGKKEVPGRPFLYATTEKFLEHFGLKSLQEMPSIEEIKNLVEKSVKKEELLGRQQIVDVPAEEKEPVQESENGPESAAQ